MHRTDAGLRDQDAAARPVAATPDEISNTLDVILSEAQDIILRAKWYHNCGCLH